MPLMTDEPPPGDAFCSRMSILLMFGDGATSSSESAALSVRGVPVPSVPETVPRVPETVPIRMLWIGEGSLPVPCSGFRPPDIEAVRGCLLEAALEGGGGRGLTIWQSWGDDGEVRVIGALPLPGVVSRSEVWCRIGVLPLSGVRDLSEFRGTGDWPLPDRTDPVLFLLTWGERVCSRA